MENHTYKLLTESLNIRADVLGIVEKSESRLYDIYWLSSFLLLK